MIRFNFIPTELRKERGGMLSQGLGGVPAEILIGTFLLVVAALFALHLLLVSIWLVQAGGHQVLQMKWNNMGSEKKVFDDIANQSKAIQARLNAMRPIISQTEFRASFLLNNISDSVPKGVWLRQIEFNRGVLTLTGSSVSKASNEMVAAGNFVSSLKSKPSIKNYFLGLEIESIQRREGTSLPIADFRLKAKRK